MKKWQYVGMGLRLILSGGALIALHHILAEVHLKEVLTHLHNIPWLFLILASLFFGGSYLALTGYDVLVLRFLADSWTGERCCENKFPTSGMWPLAF